MYYRLSTHSFTLNVIFLIQELYFGMAFKVPPAVEGEENGMAGPKEDCSQQASPIDLFSASLIAFAFVHFIRWYLDDIFIVT